MQKAGECNSIERHRPTSKKDQRYNNMMPCL